MENEEKPFRFGEKVTLWTLTAFAVSLLVVALGLVVYWAFQPDKSPAGLGFVYYDADMRAILHRTLWDWLGLLIVPLAVAAGATFISYVQKRTELDIAEKAREEDRGIAQQARQSEQQIANDSLRQATLEGYYDRMTALLLEHKLRDSAEDSEARSIACARTVAVAKSLDGERNGQLFEFLRDSKLIERESPIIDLSRANFFDVDLSGVNLSGVNLKGANLSGANLTLAKLNGANLRGASLYGAVLYQADLSEADLRDASLERANMTIATLNNANLTRGNMYGANLTGAILTGTTLSEANLRIASLREATLDRTDLRGVNLIKADLFAADLSGADLFVADLGGAINWTIEQFDKAITLQHATMPDGVRLGGPNRDGPTYAEWKAQYLTRQGSG